MKRIEIFLKFPNSQNKIKTMFTEGGWNVLKDYSKYSKELEEISLVQKGSNVELKISWKKGEEIKYTSTLPPEEEIIALLHKIRPFVLQKESTSFRKIVNLLGRKIEDDEFRDLLKEEKEIYSGKASRGVFKIASNEVVLNTDQMLKKWLNAFEYHKDKNKQLEIKKLHELIPLEATRTILIMMLQDKVKAILHISGFINVILGKKEEMAVYKDNKLEKLRFTFKRDKE